VPAVREPDVRVVDALVGRPERLTLLERHVTAVTLPRGVHDGACWLFHVILWPGCRRWRGGRPATPVRGLAGRCLSVVLRLLQLGRHLHGVCGSDASTLQLINPWADTARAKPRVFAINTGAEAQAS
jgi:hypothetical protein